MLRLYVMRHAKSSWAIPGARDFDRELNARGTSDLEKVSAALAKRGYSPEYILCSPAQRTRQTLEGIFASLDPQPSVAFDERLYAGGMQDYVDLIRSIAEPVSVMTIGHNPMSGSLANVLAGHGDPEMLSEISYRYPTATIAVIDFPIERWADMEPGTGTLLDCIIPSGLQHPDPA